MEQAKPWCGIIRLGGIGDNLIAASVLPLLAEKYNVEVITQSPQSCVFENNPYISRLIVKQPNELPSDNSEWYKWFSDRAKEYDLFVNLSHSCESLLVFFPAQSQFYWPDDWRRQWCDRSYIDTVHDIVGVPYKYGRLFFPTESEHTKAIQTKSKVGVSVIGWCLSGTRADKAYPSAGTVIARLIRETGFPVIMFGAGAFNFQQSKLIMDQVERHNGSTTGLHQAVSPEIDEDGGPAPDAAATSWSAGASGDPVRITPAQSPLWPIRRTLSQLQTCDLVIGPDTGPLWSVAFEEMRKIMLLSHASPKNITVHWKNTVTLHADPVRVSCWPCHRLHDTMLTCRSNKDKTGAACISDISVELIVQAAKDLL
jgi:ADP-heptose:LPS heptosyltransferase